MSFNSGNFLTILLYPTPPFSLLNSHNAQKSGVGTVNFFKNLYLLVLLFTVFPGVISQFNTEIFIL